jgi:hypothetical protein
VERLAVYGVTSGLAWMAAAVGVSAAPPGLAPRSPEVMLYISHAVGSGSAARPTFGLKVDQLRQASNWGDPAEGGDGMSHRELVNWQMEARSDMHISDLRVQLGHKVTYDLTNRAFGSPATRSTMQIGVPTLKSGAVGASQQRPLFAHMGVSGSSSSELGSHESSASASSVRELASAAFAALAPSRFTAPQRAAAGRLAPFDKNQPLARMSSNSISH